MFILNIAVLFCVHFSFPHIENGRLKLQHIDLAHNVSESVVLMKGVKSMILQNANGPKGSLCRIPLQRGPP